MFINQHKNRALFLLSTGLSCTESLWVRNKFEPKVMTRHKHLRHWCRDPGGFLNKVAGNRVSVINIKRDLRSLCYHRIQETLDIREPISQPQFNFLQTLVDMAVRRFEPFSHKFLYASFYIQCPGGDEISVAAESSSGLASSTVARLTRTKTWNTLCWLGSSATATSAR
ncbi:hypothetical protein B0H17DRAFT_1068099 [Mycena rosella]|uniref:Uncharacterized protein n=1 Tax=Mycena rosella TaxID=1033263 RepID=A0AAD7DCW4_MYCRO|nr:hypothetical protein B0H17DRAFT_1068099 [Mycena rosella]